ncbi:MAG: hypothetical protein CM15mP24_2720 [Candidatus Pelagibacterales bacterium]|nr:MAG: hypothetical protein CM15mP24_2720 [Pelagibacterales bacterium]
MILQYFKKKENKEQIIATEQYKKIIAESNLFLNENNFFKIKDYKTSFEIVSIFLIMFIRINLLENNRKKYLKVNDELVSLFISDLDESLREKGIGDMSIGKYVKSYVKKFYFRISKFPDDNNLYKNESFIEYLKITDLIKNDDYVNVSRKFNDKFVDFINSSN